MGKILEKDLTVGEDNKVVVELPPSNAHRVVKVTVEDCETPLYHRASDDIPTLEELRSMPVRWEIPQQFQRKGSIRDDVIDSLSEDELRQWEESPL